MIKDIIFKIAEQLEQNFDFVNKAAGLVENKIITKNGKQTVLPFAEIGIYNGTLCDTKENELFIILPSIKDECIVFFQSLRLVENINATGFIQYNGNLVFNIWLNTKLVNVDEPNNLAHALLHKVLLFNTENFRFTGSAVYVEPTFFKGISYDEKLQSFKLPPYYSFSFSLSLSYIQNKCFEPTYVINDPKLC